jgi:hypothetical protein
VYPRRRLIHLTTLGVLLAAWLRSDERRVTVVSRPLRALT